MRVMKLSKMPYAQAHIELIEGNVYFFSYNTLAAAIVDGWLSVFCLCSQTTRKHVGAFVREWAGTEYSTAKTIHKDKLSYNIETGEVVPQKFM